MLDCLLALTFSSQKTKSFNRPDLRAFGKKTEFMPEGPGKGREKERLKDQ